MKTYSGNEGVGGLRDWQEEVGLLSTFKRWAISARKEGSLDKKSPALAIKLTEREEAKASEVKIRDQTEKLLSSRMLAVRKGGILYWIEGKGKFILTLISRFGSQRLR